MMARSIFPHIRLAHSIALLTTMISLVVLIGIGGLSYQAMQTQIRKEQGNALQSIVGNHAALVDGHLHSLENTASSMAANTLFANALVDSTGRHIYLEPFLKGFNSVDGLTTAIWVADFMGRTIARNPGARTIQIDPAHLIPVVDTATPASWLEKSRLFTAHPIIYSSTGSAEGVLIFSVDLTSSIQAFGTTTSAPSMLLSVHDKYGTLVLQHPADAIPRQDAPVTASIALSAPLAKTNGLTLQLTPLHDDVTPELNRLLLDYMVIGLIALLLSVGLSILAGRYLTRRLEELRRTAGEIVSTGGRNVRCHLDGTDEAAEMADAFNHMLDRLEFAYQALADSSKREIADKDVHLHTIVQAAGEGYLEVDPETGLVTAVNDALCALLERPADTLLGHPPPLPVMMPPTNEGPIVRVTRDISLHRSDGVAFVQVGQTAIISDGQVSKLFAFITDISSHRQAQMELEAKNQELEQFAYVASHDLQEPLRMVASYTQILLSRYGDVLDDNGREFAGYAIDGAKRMQNLINDLLQYSRIGTQAAPFQPAELTDLCDIALENLKARITETDAAITVESLPCANVDAGQISRLFQNLIGNALKYCAPDRLPQITVRAEMIGEEWVISVEDNGIGIAASDHERVFRIFQRLHGNREIAGTGIGLAICKRIVERHSGVLNVESDVGIGSRFFFTLPVDRNLVSAAGVAPGNTDDRLTNGEGQRVAVQ